MCLIWLYNIFIAINETIGDILISPMELCLKLRPGYRYLKRINQFFLSNSLLPFVKSRFIKSYKLMYCLDRHKSAVGPLIK
jgi:hypothetical protein